MFLPRTNVSDGMTIYSKLCATVNGLGEPQFPHHPLNCNEPSTWDINEETFSCKHKTVPIGDEKTQAAIVYSIAELIIEEAYKL